jgi:hypothetical protein
VVTARRPAFLGGRVVELGDILSTTLACVAALYEKIALDFSH